MEILACNWSPTFLLIFSDNVYAPLIYYSHLVPLTVSLLIGGLVLLNNPREQINRVLFGITIAFSLWVFFDLVLWATENPDYVMFFWSAIVPVELLIYTGCLYFVALIGNKKRDTSLLSKIGIAILFIPIVVLGHTSYNLLGFDYTNCDRGAIEGPLIQYLYIVELFIITLTALVAISKFRSIKEQETRKQLLYLSIGTLFFMLTFTAGNITLIFSLDWQYEQYKLFGMPIFVAFIAYSIVRFRAFSMKLLGAQALVVGLSVAVLSLLFIRTIGNVRIIAALTFVLIVVLGYNLVRSVKREVQLREQTQELAAELEKTNKRQETLLHFVGHEVKNFLTKDQGAFAALLEGDVGQLPDTMRSFVERALAQTRDGVYSVTAILKASNQKSGTVTYEMAPFDLGTAAAAAVERARPLAEEKGLSLTFTADSEGAPYTLNGDKDEISDHVLRNLIENAINYTPSGSVYVTLRRETGKMVFIIQDTGVGITEEDKKVLFTEGGHGKDSRKVNSHSTGYGLFIAKNIVEAHGGSVRADSEGPGKGSTFTVEIPA